MTLSGDGEDGGPRETRGILSEADRTYLQNRGEYSRQAANERQKRITERIRAAVLDFQYLAAPEFPDELLENAFSAAGDADEYESVWAEGVQRGAAGATLSDPAVDAGVVEALAFFHRVYPPERFNQLVEDGVTTAVDRYYPDVEVVDASYNPDIRDRQGAHDVAKSKLEDGRPLTAEQSKLLIQWGEVDPDRVVENIRGAPIDDAQPDG